MTYPVIDPREDDGSGSPGRMLSVVFPALLFLLGFALFTVTFNVDENLRAWVFAGGIAAVSLAFAIPLSIAPALEERAHPSARR